MFLQLLESYIKNMPPGLCISSASCGKVFKIKANRRILQPATSTDRSPNLLILSIKHEETKKSNLDKVIEKLQK